MSAQPSEHDGHDVIRPGGETAVVVPMHEYHTLKALRDRASAEQVEEAEIDAAIAIGRRPSVAARLHAAERALANPDPAVRDQAVREAAEIVQAAYREVAGG